MQVEGQHVQVVEVVHELTACVCVREVTLNGKAGPSTLNVGE